MTMVQQQGREAGRVVGAAGLRCLALLVLLLHALDAGAQSRPPAQTPFTFVVLSDTHVGRQKDADRLRQAIAIIHDLRPAPKLVIITGDLTDRGRASQFAEYKSILAELPMPVFDVPGNHDIGFRSPADRVERFQRELGRPALPHSLTIDGRHFVGFNSMLLYAHKSPPGPTDPGFDQLDRLEKMLAGLPPGPVFLLAHVPPAENVQKGLPRIGWDPVFLRRFREILEKHPVTAMLAGHFHRDEMHFVAGVPLLVAPAISGKFDQIQSLRIVTDDERGLRYEQLYYGPRGRGRSYHADLRGLTEGVFRDEVLSLNESDLDDLWLRSNTWVATPPAAKKRLTPQFLRHLLLSDPTSPTGEIGEVMATAGSTRSPATPRAWHRQQRRTRARPEQK